MGVQQPSSNNNHADAPTTCSTYDISATTNCPSKPESTSTPTSDQAANSNKQRVKLQREGKGGADVDSDYREIVDELSKIVLKYKSSWDIIIAGDMNASTARDKPNTRDKILLDFIQEHCLYTPNGLCDVNTYFHPSGTCSTQIDYIIESTPGKDGSTQTSCLKVDNEPLTTPHEIRNGWTNYFQELATPHHNKTIYHNQVELDCLLEDIFKSNQKSQIIVSKNLVKEVICQLKNGKAADSAGICSEHLKYGGETLIHVLTKLFNLIFRHCTLPELFEMGKITVSSVINKVTEKLHLNDNSAIIEKIQNYLQRGFTTGVSPIFAAIIITELSAEVKELKLLLVLALPDAQKAFDKLWLSSLLRKTYQIAIDGDKWLMLKAWYHELASQVKWSGGLSRPFSEKQGVRQGGVKSSTAYKIFINPLLNQLHQN
ncbi:unnamed protein product [Mytilus coruscus]|uniref:Reverse transcriptase domain-containing protein n=1 Tax=Mytilus coruscus TaxID=42192 RepID=A0A6J8BWW0_MYTCO|nr:unnamed protein product [Mytilus coruscus]